MTGTGEIWWLIALPLRCLFKSRDRHKENSFEIMCCRSVNYIVIGTRHDLNSYHFLEQIISQWPTCPLTQMEVMALIHGILREVNEMMLLLSLSLVQRSAWQMLVKILKNRWWWLTSTIILSTHVTAPVTYGLHIFISLRTQSVLVLKYFGLDLWMKATWEQRCSLMLSVSGSWKMLWGSWGQNWAS